MPLAYWGVYFSRLPFLAGNKKVIGNFVPPPLDIGCLVAGETVELGSLKRSQPPSRSNANSTASDHLHQRGGVRGMEQVNKCKLLKGQNPASVTSRDGQCTAKYCCLPEIASWPFNLILKVSTTASPASLLCGKPRNLRRGLRATVSMEKLACGKQTSWLSKRIELECFHGHSDSKAVAVAVPQSSATDEPPRRSY